MLDRVSPLRTEWIRVLVVAAFAATARLVLGALAAAVRLLVGAFAATVRLPPPGIVSVRPTAKRRGERPRLAATSAFRLTPYLRAMCVSVSPLRTRWVRTLGLADASNTFSRARSVFASEAKS